MVATGLASFGSTAWSRPTTSHGSLTNPPGIAVTGVSVQKSTAIPCLAGSFGALTATGSFRLPQMSTSLHTVGLEQCSTLSPVVADVGSPTKQGHDECMTSSRWAHRSGPVRGLSFKGTTPLVGVDKAPISSQTSEPVVITTEVLRITRSHIKVMSEPRVVTPSQQRSPQMAHRTLKVSPQQTAVIRLSDDNESPYCTPARPAGGSPYTGKPELKIVPIRAFTASTPKSRTSSSISPWSVKLSTCDSVGTFEFPEAALVDRLPAVVIPVPKQPRNFNTLDDTDSDSSSAEV